MTGTVRWQVIHMAIAAAIIPSLSIAEQVLEVRTPMTPPEWALLEREVLRAGSEAVEQFYSLTGQTTNRGAEAAMVRHSFPS